jgi:hypothetical protein
VLFRSSELANKKLNEYADQLSREELDSEFPDGLEVFDEDEDTVTYTEEAQDIFNQFYDEFYDFLWNLKED